MLIHRKKKKKRKKDEDATYLSGWVSDVLLKSRFKSAKKNLCSGVKWSSNLEVLNKRDV